MEQSQTEPVQELNLQDATGLLHFLHVNLVHRHLVWRPLPSSGTSRRAEWPGDSHTLGIKPYGAARRQSDPGHQAVRSGQETVRPWASSCAERPGDSQTLGIKPRGVTRRQSDPGDLAALFQDDGVSGGGAPGSPGSHPPVPHRLPLPLWGRD